MAAPLLLPDSNFFILATRRRQDPFHILAAHTLDWDIATCGMVRLEVVRGRIERAHRLRFEAAFDHMIDLPATDRVWQRATEVAWSLDRQGIVLPATDLLIAALALENDATLITYDAHFRNIPGLRVIAQL